MLRHGNHPPVPTCPHIPDFLRPAAHKRVLRMFSRTDLSPTIGSLLGTCLILCLLNAGQTSMYCCYIFKDNSRLAKCQIPCNPVCVSFFCLERNVANMAGLAPAKNETHPATRQPLLIPSTLDTIGKMNI